MPGGIGVLSAQQELDSSRPPNAGREESNAQQGGKEDMDKLQRDTEPNNGWTIKFATLKALREQAKKMGENPSEEEVEAVALAMVGLGYALIDMPNAQVDAPSGATAE